MSSILSRPHCVNLISFDLFISLWQVLTKVNPLTSGKMVDILLQTPPFRIGKMVDILLLTPPFRIRRKFDFADAIFQYVLNESE